MPAVSYGVPSFDLPAHPVRACLPCLDLFPIRDITSASTRSGRTPSPDPFRPRAFSAPRRVAPPSVLRAYCIPLPRPGFFYRSGVSPGPQPSWLIASACLRDVATLLLAGKPAATSGCLAFEALLRGPKRSSRSGFSLPLRRSPLRVSLLLQVFDGSPCARFPGPSAHDVACEISPRGGGSEPLGLGRCPLPKLEAAHHSVARFAGARRLAVTARPQRLAGVSSSAPQLQEPKPPSRRTTPCSRLVACRAS